MPPTLPEHLPKLVAEGRRRAGHVLRAASENSPGMRLRTHDYTVPVTSAGTVDGLPRLHPAAAPSREWTDRLILGDNLPAMGALLAGDEDTPGLAGRIDLIYVDPPPRSQADYRAQVALPPLGRKRLPTVLAPFAYSDVWPDGASYLQATVARLVLMRELLAESGSILVHLAGPDGARLRLALDEIFGAGNFVRNVIWCRAAENGTTSECIAHYAKTRRRWQGESGETAAAQAKLDSPILEGRHAPMISDGIAAVNVARPPSAASDASGPPSSNDELCYSQQKPLRLLESLIDYACPAGGLVADFYAGSGTCAVAATRLGRRWIAADASPLACTIARKRLAAAKAGAYRFQSIDPRVGTVHPPSAHEFVADDLAVEVLAAYGATPLPPAEDPTGNLGACLSDGKKTLVRVDSPHRRTGEVSLERAIAQFEDGWERVVVLGWAFEPALRETLIALQRHDLDVLAIPPGVFERGHCEDGTGEARRHFRSLRQLSVQPIRRERISCRETMGDSKDAEIITVALGGFVLLSPWATDLDAKDLHKLAQVCESDPLALIEYWAVDPDYDGQLFRSVWQAYRGGPVTEADPLRVAMTASFALPYRNGERRVCVRAVDVFGVEVEVVVSASVPDAVLDGRKLWQVREGDVPSFVEEVELMEQV